VALERIPCGLVRVGLFSTIPFQRSQIPAANGQVCLFSGDSEFDRLFGIFCGQYRRGKGKTRSVFFING